MEEFRSKSCGDRRIPAAGESSNAQKPNPPTTLQDLRCYSASYAQTTTTETQIQISNANSNKEIKFKKGGKSLTKNWSLNNPKLQRKKMVASYKVYTVKGKVKGSLRKSFRWLKDRNPSPPFTTSIAE
ncbi:hypothetical protein LguiA_020146 [Lonicera macranthoides]